MEERALAAVGSLKRGEEKGVVGDAILDGAW
jgi:hypothetical protein